jgi:hypothetical protein
MGQGLESPVHYDVAAQSASFYDQLRLVFR